MFAYLSLMHQIERMNLEIELSIITFLAIRYLLITNKKKIINSKTSWKLILNVQLISIIIFKFNLIKFFFASA